jgi:ATP-dependent DNA helicase RecG
MASLTDLPLIEKAREQAQKLFAVDPDLSRPEDALLAESLERYWGNTQSDVS